VVNYVIELSDDRYALFGRADFRDVPVGNFASGPKHVVGKTYVVVVKKQP